MLDIPLASLTHWDVKAILERKLAHQKRGVLSVCEVGEAVAEFKDLRQETRLSAQVVEKKKTED